MEMSHGQMMHDEKRYIEDPGAMMAEHPNMMKWVQPALMILGIWLATSPLIFSYGDPAMLWNDVMAGVVTFADLERLLVTLKL